MEKRNLCIFNQPKIFWDDKKKNGKFEIEFGISDERLQNDQAIIRRLNIYIRSYIEGLKYKGLL